MTDKIEEIRAALEGATRGPWFNTGQSGEITDADGYYIGRAVGAETRVGRANARIFTLAPDMARAAVKHVKWLEHERAVCEAAGDRAGVIAYGRALAAYCKAVEGGE